MAFSNLLKMLILSELMFIGARLSGAALSFDYYANSCRFVENIVWNVVNEELQKDPTLSAGLLRMHFHDCFVEGCDGSVLVDSTKDNTAEKDSPANISLRGFEIIDKAKEVLESQCKGVVSCADIVAMAARDAVSWARGPFYSIPMGRMDGRRSRIEDTRNLPPPDLDSSSLIKIFGKHGLTVEDMVALSGGHTLGVARCASFKNRLSNSSIGQIADSSLNPVEAIVLSKTCSSGDNSTAPFDVTSTTFDNMYYVLLRMGSGVLTSDETLFTGHETRSIVDEYAWSQDKFFLGFSSAMVKMGLIDVKEGEGGEVRLNCRKIN